MTDLTVKLYQTIAINTYTLMYMPVINMPGKNSKYYDGSQKLVSVAMHKVGRCNVRFFIVLISQMVAELLAETCSAVPLPNVLPYKL